VQPAGGKIRIEQEGGDKPPSCSILVGHSLLTARGIPCNGEGDLKTALAMKICDILGLAAPFRNFW
jgi:hypothetical protein